MTFEVLAASPPMQRRELGAGIRGSPVTSVAVLADEQEF